MQILHNGRRCGSVEKFTEMILNNSGNGDDDNDGDNDGDNENNAEAANTATTTIGYVSVPRDMVATEFSAHSSTHISSVAPTTISPLLPPPPSWQTSTFAGSAAASAPSPSSSSSVMATRTGQPLPSQSFQPRSIIKNSYLNQLTRQTMTKAPPPPTIVVANGGRHAQRGPISQEFLYRPNAAADSSSSSVPTQKTYERLAEVYSASDDTAQFTRNMRTFISEHVPWSVWIGFAVLEIVLGLVSLFIGALNLPMCEIQPMIPMYLMLSGGLLITHGIVRIFASLPTPAPRRPNTAQKSRLFRDLCVYALEALVVLAIVVVVILGGVWTYGARYVHFHRDFFEDDYCDRTIYWVAWWSVTAHLVVFVLFIFAVVFVLIYGSMISK